MCGIFAFLSILNQHNLLIRGLKQLQNRGYDSAGVAYFENNIFLLNKIASTDNLQAIDKLSNIKFEDTRTGIAHTRWATHGIRNDINSHPHLDCYGKFAIVHNGIIENFQQLKTFLISKGYTFSSQTDTEVIVNLIHYYYIQFQSIEEAIHQSITRMSGTWGCVLLDTQSPDRLYCFRSGSPLLIGINDDIIIVSSEQAGFCGLVNNYIKLENKDLAILIRDNKTIRFESSHTYNPIEALKSQEQLTPDPYPHWTLLEISQQRESILRAMGMGGRIANDNQVKLGGLYYKKQDLSEIDNLIMLGCGTSYYAASVARYYFQDLTNLNTIQVFDGADFTPNDIPPQGKTAIILISQSGETLDLYRCIDIGRNSNCLMIGIVNVVDSMIAREVDCGCYLNAGREVSVASTKAFTSQLVVLSLVAIYVSQVKKINANKRKKYIRDLRKLNYQVEDVISGCHKWSQNVSKYLVDKTSLFILGKGKTEGISKEGALKIKEIGYIHTEGYSSSSLKHGPFSLLVKGFPIIMIISKNNATLHSKLMNSYQEVKCRGAEIFIITNDSNYNQSNNNQSNHTLNIPFNQKYNEILSVIPLQMVAYHLAIEKGHNPDFPRNLAKVVTVE